jgi:fatty acid desaturase
MTAPIPQEPDEDRKAARKRLEDKRKFRSDVFAYVVVNAFLVLVWALGERGDFWPGWVMAGWGVLLLLDYYRVFLREPITEADVEQEVRRGRPAG